MVLYQSKGGSTEKVAKAIASATNTTAHNVKQPFDYGSIEDGSLLFVGGAIYAGKLDKSLDACLHAIADAKKNVKLALFGTSAAPDAAVKALRQNALALGLSCLETSFNCRGKFLLAHRGHPDAADLVAAVDFAKKVLQDNA